MSALGSQGQPVAAGAGVVIQHVLADVVVGEGAGPVADLGVQDDPDLPLQVAMYPVAGICGIALGLPVYLLASENSAYTACFIGLVAAMRVETGFERRFPHYRTRRHLLRLGLIFAFMTYFVVHEQGGSLGMAVLVSALFTAFMHFFLRWGWSRGLWDGLQVWGWLRKE